MVLTADIGRKRRIRAALNDAPGEACDGQSIAQRYGEETGKATADISLNGRLHIGDDLHMPVITFEEALGRTAAAKRHLLIGNGFSISLFPDRFRYDSLLRSADFSDHPEARQAFDLLNTTDFEVVIHALRQAVTLIPLYSEDNMAKTYLARPAEWGSAQAAGIEVSSPRTWRQAGSVHRIHTQQSSFSAKRERHTQSSSVAAAHIKKDPVRTGSQFGAAIFLSRIIAGAPNRYRGKDFINYLAMGFSEVLESEPPPSRRFAHALATFRAQARTTASSSL